MIGIVESGSTKTSWHFVNEKNERYSYQTLGFNPAYQESNDISEVIKRDLLSAIEFKDRIRKIYYYGASCEAEGNREKVRVAFRNCMPDTPVTVMHDLLAAAKALFGENEGIACISGTGSNTCYYDGKEVVKNIHSLGLFLGDEGSGGYKGKLLIIMYIRETLSASMMQAFKKEFPLDPEEILANIYSGKMPSRYLASFAPFILKNIHEPEMYKLVYQSYEELFDRCILKYPKQNLPIGFVGSIAYHFKDVLMKVAESKGRKVSVIDPNPSEALVRYHVRKEFPAISAV